MRLRARFARRLAPCVVAALGLAGAMRETPGARGAPPLRAAARRLRRGGAAALAVAALATLPLAALTPARAPAASFT